MTEMRRTSAMDAVSPPFNHTASLRPMLLQGAAGLMLGVVLTVLAVIFSQGVLGFLSLVTVLGSIAWISLGVVRHFAGRLRRA